VERVADTVAILKKSKLLLLENLETLKQRTKLLTLMLQEPEMSTPGLFSNIIKERVSGRDVSILEQNLSEDAQELLRSNSNISKYELRSASLEEIFIGLMEK
jgi:ABC-2 type transport system ATP-binding protein